MKKARKFDLSKEVDREFKKRLYALKWKRATVTRIMYELDAARTVAVLRWARLPDDE